MDSAAKFCVLRAHCENKGVVNSPQFWPNFLKLRVINCSLGWTKFELGLTHEKFGVWTGPKMRNLLKGIVVCALQKCCCSSSGSLLFFFNTAHFHRALPAFLIFSPSLWNVLVFLTTKFAFFVFYLLLFLALALALILSLSVKTSQFVWKDDSFVLLFFLFICPAGYVIYC